MRLVAVEEAFWFGQGTGSARVRRTDPAAFKVLTT
jgi:hypothetical protein